MAGKLITTGIDGIIVNSEAFSNAHDEWWDLWAKKLGMPELKECAHKPQEEYWPGVKKAMETYFGRFSKHEGVINSMARLEYQMMVLRCADKLLEKDELILPYHEACIDLFKMLKGKGHRFAMVTSSPPDAIEPLLREIDCYDLFDYVYASKLDAKPSTKDVYAKMCSEIDENPAAHIAAGLSGVEAGLKFNVPTILTTWDNSTAGYKEIEKADIHAIFTAEGVIQLRNQLEVLLNS